MSRNSSFSWSRWPLWGAQGFRISAIDIVIIIITIFVSWHQWEDSNGLIALLPVVLAHFFLFCNVFRVHRRLELIWAAMFLITGGIWLACQPLAWWWLVVWQLPVTIIVLICEICSKRYHGVAAKYVNKGHGSQVLDNKP